MAELSRILIALTFVVHMTVGCCFHHVHADDGASSCAASSQTDTHDDHPCSSSDGQSHENGKTCQGISCSFVTPKRLSSPILLPSFGEASFVAFLHDSPPSGDSLQTDFAWSSERLSLPIRLHLVYQVFLI
jgi:hypothetical protein